MPIKPGTLLRIEGGCVLVLSILCYREVNANWILFIALLLVPDLAILGYLHGVRAGTVLYNLVHTLTGPLLLIGFAILEKSPWLLAYGLIWTSHIGLDRLLGFGLKYPTRFKDANSKGVGQALEGGAKEPEPRAGTENPDATTFWVCHFSSRYIEFLRRVVDGSGTSDNLREGCRAGTLLRSHS